MPSGKIIYPKLSYLIVGFCYSAHNDLGRFAREKQYGDHLERSLINSKLKYKRELTIGEDNNILDFLIEDKIVLELKAKQIITKNDYFQVQRYLHSCNIRLGILINFRNKFIRPKRIIRIKNKFI